MKRCEIKARHICAMLGVAIAAGAVIFMQSLVATNDFQSVAIAEKLLREMPVEKSSRVATLAIDYRPENRVMQGPPLVATIATDSALATNGIAIAKSVFLSRKLPLPAIGEELTFVGRSGVYRLKVAKILDWSRPMGRGAMYPNAFISPVLAKGISEDWREYRESRLEAIAMMFKSDSSRNFDRAKVLLLWAAILTALCLLANTLFLSVEARRRDIAIMRTLGLSRLGVIKLVAKEAFFLALGGAIIGANVATGALAIFVAMEKKMFPLGLAISVHAILATIIATPLLAIIASLIVMKRSLSVKPLEAVSAEHTKKHHLGMIISFAFGFGAFVAVEVWGASLMKAFVPSPEWPDAIASILPGGVSSFEIEKLKDIEGVGKIAELQPLQVNLKPLEELKGGPARGGRDSRQVAYRNALLLASDWLPNFNFVAGSHDEAVAMLSRGDNCIVTEMMARAHGWKLGDKVELSCGRNLNLSLAIVGIVDLNWHMVTSRALVRGLNRMPVHTDGPVFVSFDTLAAADLRPQHMVAMTHLWFKYDRDFLAKFGAFEAGRKIEKEIVARLGEKAVASTVRVHARDEIADGTLAHGANLIGAMARVPFIFIAVLSLGFVTMLVASFESRSREFLVLRSVGATRFQLAMILVREVIEVAIKGILFGFLGGAIIGWLFTFATRSAMANWGLPASFEIPFSPITTGVLIAILFAILVATPTSFFLLRKRGKK